MMKIVFLFLITTNILLASIGSITLVDGKVNIKRANQTLLVKVGDGVEKNDHIYTEANSKAKITFNDNTVITIGKNSTLDIADYLYDAKNSSANKTDLKVAKGAFHAITGEVGKLNPSKFKLKTSTASIGIRGTEIYGDQASVFCTDGAIFVESFDVHRDIPSGNYVLTYDNAIPSEVMPIDTSGIDDVKSKLNTLSLADGFENSSTPINTSPETPITPAITSAYIAPQTSTEATPTATMDSMDSWGRWSSDITEDSRVVAINDVEQEIVEDVIDDGTSEPRPTEPTPIEPIEPEPTPTPIEPEPEPTPPTPEPTPPTPEPEPIPEVTGNITSAAYVQYLIDKSAATSLYFSGIITPANPAIHGITKNYINLNFVFGFNNPELYGDYEFVAEDGINLAGNLGSFYNEREINKDGFYARDSGGSSWINGKFYGSTIDGVKGSINMASSDNKKEVLGIFSATESEPPLPPEPSPIIPPPNPMSIPTSVTVVQDMIANIMAVPLQFVGEITPNNSSIQNINSSIEITVTQGGGTAPDLYGYYSFEGLLGIDNIYFSDNFDGTINGNSFSATGLDNPTDISGTFYGPNMDIAKGTINMQDIYTGGSLPGTFAAGR